MSNGGKGGCDAAMDDRKAVNPMVWNGRRDVGDHGRAQDETPHQEWNWVVRRGLSRLNDSGLGATMQIDDGGNQEAVGAKTA